MDDIVARLRKTYLAFGDAEEIRTVMNKAAAEIESLRAELARACKHAADMNDGWRKANFENHDLRANLTAVTTQRDEWQACYAATRQETQSGSK